MKRLPAFLFPVAAVLVFSCEPVEEKNERLAKQYCGNCHLYPEPELLDKRTWKHSVMPQMAFLMGFPDAAIQSRLNPRDMEAVLAAVPQFPILTKEDFQSIVDHYVRHSPDSIFAPVPPAGSLETFNKIDVKALHGELVTALKYARHKRELFVGTRSGKLYKLNHMLAVADSAQMRSAISDIKVLTDEIIVSQMGIMDPTEQARGEITSLGFSMEKERNVFDSLQRPVFFEKVDLNRDGIGDFVICNFGNYTGNILILEGSKTPGTYTKHFLNRMPGARKVIVRDFNSDKLPDVLVLMTQGDERIVLYYNTGDFSFKEYTAIRFPPVYGSNSMEIADVNDDGFLDIITTNGDNGDYSVVHKPYHGVRLFENDGRNSFKEVWSVSMPGATQAKVDDFDQDGDLDIAAISFFPKAGNESAGSFFFFENLGFYSFRARSIRDFTSGRLLVMETGDFDNDTDTDIFLGSFNYNGLGARQLDMADYSSKELPSLLVLENTRN